MDRSQEDAPHLSPKAPVTGNGIGNAPAKHEIVNVRTAFPQDSAVDKSSEILSVEKLSGKKADQLLSPLQGAFFHPVSGAALGMSVPYSMFHAATFDPRMIYAAYSNPMMSFPNFAGGYANHHEQGKSFDDAMKSAKNSVPSTRSERTNHSPKDSLRTESVIKTVTDRQDAKATSGHMEKQSNLSRPVVDRENEKNGKNTGPIRDGQALRQGEIDLSRTSVIPSRKIHEPCTRDAQTTSRKTNDRPVSRPYENGAFATNEKGHTDHRSPYTNLPEKDATSSTASSGVPSTMPILMPIAPRVSNSSPYSVHHAPEIDHRSSAGPNSRKPQNYHPYFSSNSASSRGSSPSERPSYRDKAEVVDFAWRKDNAMDDADKFGRNYYLQHQLPWEQRPHGMPVLTRAPGYGGNSEPRATNGTHVKANGGKEVADVKMRESASESAEIERTDDANVSNHSQHAGGNAKNGKSAFSSENVRYKLNDERGKSSLQTEKVKIRDKQGVPYLLSVREDTRRPRFSDLTKHGTKADSREHAPSSAVDGALEKKDATFYPGTQADHRGKQANSKESLAKDDSAARSSDSFARVGGFNDDGRVAPGHREETKKSNDRNNNNNNNGGLYSYLNGYGSSALPPEREQERGYGGHHTAAFTMEKLFVPPNATLDMYERREKELRADQLRVKESDAAHEEHSSHRERFEISKGGLEPKDVRRSVQRGDGALGPIAKQLEKDKTSARFEVRNADEEEKRNGKSDSVTSQPSNRLPASSSSSSTLSKSQLSAHLDRNGASPANVYASAFGAGVFGRRENGTSSRESGADGVLNGAAKLVYPGSGTAASLWGGSVPYPPSFLTAQGRADSQPVFFDPLSYGAMCRPPMVDAASQGAVLADPFGAPFLMLPPDPAYFLNSRDGAFFMDPNFPHAWAMPGSQEDPRMQQYHLMQQQKYLQLVHHYQQQQQNQQQQQQQQQPQQQQKSTPQSQTLLPNNDKLPLGPDQLYLKYMAQVKEKELEKADDEQSKARPHDKRADSTESTGKAGDTQANSSRDLRDVADVRQGLPERPPQSKGTSLDETRDESKLRFQQYLKNPANFALQQPESFALAHVSVEPRSASPKTVSAAETLSAMERNRAVDGQRTDHLKAHFRNGAGDMKLDPGAIERAASDAVYGSRPTSRGTAEREDTGSKLMTFGTEVRASEHKKGEPSGGHPLRESLLRGYERAPFESGPGNGSSSASLTQDSRSEQVHDVKNRNGLSETTDNRRGVASKEKFEEGSAIRKELTCLKLDSKKELLDRLCSMGSHGTQIFSALGGSGADLEDSFSTKCELRRLESSFLPVKPDLDTNNKENTAEFTVKTIKTEAERQEIRANIDRLRRLAKRRSSKERFTRFLRRSEVRSPATIVSDVTSGVGDSVGMQDGEKEMRMRLAELQKKYREKARELARLQPKGKDGDDCKSIQIKRGPGRPRKRKYFGAGSKGGKSTPTNPTTVDAESSKSDAGVPELQYAAPDIKTPVTDVSVAEPTKKKKKKASSEAGEKDERPEDCSEETLRQPSPKNNETKPTIKSKKKGSNSSTERSQTPPTVSSGRSSANLITPDTVTPVVTPGVTPVFEETPNSERESSVSLASSPVEDGKITKTKKVKSKKRPKPKAGAPATEGAKNAEGTAPNDVVSRQDGERAQTPIKKKKIKVKKKKKKRPSSDSSPSIVSPTVDCREDFAEAKSTAPSLFTSEIAKANDNVAPESSQEDLSENDDVFFTTTFEPSNPLDWLASFAATDKPTTKASLPLPTNKKSKKNPAKTASNVSKKKNKKIKDVDQTSLEDDETRPEELSQPGDEGDDLKDKNKELAVQETETSDDTTTEKDESQKEDIPTQAPQPVQEEKKAESSSSAESVESRLGFSVFDDLWQPRRSERIFLNSSVTSATSASPLSSPGGKADPDWTLKKPKKATSTRKKSAKPNSNTGESEDAESSKTGSKIKRKKPQGKSVNRRRLSSVSEVESEEAGISPKRPRPLSRQPIESDDAEEDDEETLAEHDQQDEEMYEEEQEGPSKQEPAVSEPAEEVNPPDAWSAEPVAMETRIDGGEAGTSTTDNEAEAEKKLEVSESSKEQPSTPEQQPEARSETEAQNSANQDGKSLDSEFRFMFERKELTEGAKMLLLVDGVFVRGYVQSFQDPDLFGVVVAGERGRRPHWRSTDQLLSHAVKDVKPPSLESLHIGCRVCAHWSPQYRCFYLGMVAEVPPDEKVEDGKVWIEFDDGDSGWFQLDEIRRINPEFPVEEVDPPPSLPEKRVRPSSLKNPSLRLKAEIVSEASSGNESSGELRAKRRCRKRVRHQPKGESELSDSETSKSREIREKRRNFVDRRVSDRKTEASKKHKNSNKDDSGASAQFRAKEKNDPCRTGSPSRMTESASKNMTKSEGKANPESTRNSRGAKARDSSSSKQEKTGEEPNRKLSNHVEAEWKDKRDRQATSLRSIKEETLERSGEGEGTSDPEKQEKRSKVKHQSRSADMDLRRKSLTLNLNNSVRTRVEADSPVRESGSVDDDSESCSDAFDDSPLVEMKHFQPRLGKRRRSELDRLREDLKSSGKLWQWSGRSFLQNKRKGKGKKIFYKAITRGDETISVGDCAVFLSNPTKNNSLPYVGRIESLWEGCSANMVVRVKWFYHPEETKPGRRPTDGKYALYRSTHVDENDVQTIMQKCEVLPPDDYKRRTQESTGTRSQAQQERLFCCIGTYDPNTEVLTLE